MNYRIFSICLLCVISVFIGLNAIIWFIWTKDLTSPQRKGGDLLRLGYIHGFVSPRPQAPPLSRQHIEVKNFSGQPVDMVTVGDSFSVGSAGCYQDHLASALNISVLNIPTPKDLSFYPLPMLAKLINSGYLDRIKPRYLLLQTAEREAINRLVSGFTLADSATLEELEREFSGVASNRRREITPLDLDRNLRFINNGNWKFVANNIQYRIRDSAFDSKVIMSQLNRPFFSNKKANILIFHRDDVKAARKATSLTMEKLNNNLNHLSDILRAKGIILIFMPAPDKLTLYGPYLKNRSYPRSVFFDELEKLPKRYRFINTKQILSRELSAGVLDLYYQDDTHWSWKACESIAKNLPNAID